MKRSEMIELMMEEIGHIQDIEGVERLLTKMENAGMLPPYNPIYLDPNTIAEYNWIAENNS